MNKAALLTADAEKRSIDLQVIAEKRQKALESLIGALRTIDPATRPEAAQKLMNMAADALEQLSGKEGP